MAACALTLFAVIAAGAGGLLSRGSGAYALARVLTRRAVVVAGGDG